VIPRGLQIPQVDARCVCYTAGVAETILHRFNHCEKTRIAWSYGLRILYLSQGIPKVNDYWDTFTWQQCILGSRLPHKLKRGTALSSLLRGTILWLTWINRNTRSFNQENWLAMKIQWMLWEATLNLGRSTWTKPCTYVSLDPGLLVSICDPLIGFG
jgi:hypothetical protein